MARDVACYVTGHIDYREAAHLCPKAENEWFKKNRMRKYCRNQMLPPEYLLDDGRNAIALRMDIHRAFDDRKFILTPGEKPTDDWMVRFIQPTADCGFHYHGASVKLNAEVAPEFLLVRFAWAIFPCIQDFLTGTVLRKVSILKLTEEGEEEAVERWNQVEMQKHLRPQRRPRSESPPISISEASASHSPNYHPQKTRYDDSPSRRTHLIPTAYTPDDYTPLENLAFEWRRKGRPTNPALLCCDYTAAERDHRAGLEGQSELDGHYICRKCAGLDEYYGEEPSFCDA